MYSVGKGSKDRDHFKCAENTKKIESHKWRPLTLAFVRDQPIKIVLIYIISNAIIVHNPLVYSNISILVFYVIS